MTGKVNEDNTVMITACTIQGKCYDYINHVRNPTYCAKLVELKIHAVLDVVSMYIAQVNMNLWDALVNMNLWDALAHLHYLKVL